MSAMDKRETVSGYESMTTEELQEILRERTRDELEMDTDELYEILEVLAVRREQEDPHAFRSSEEALEEFRKYYMPKATRTSPKRWLKAITGIAAVLVVAIMGLTITVEAFDVNVWGKVASWSKEIFRFSDSSETVVTEPDHSDAIVYSEIKDLLEEYKITEKLAPTWLPDGYTVEDISVMDNPKGRLIYATFKKNGEELIINIRQMIGASANQVEKNEDLLEVYKVNGIEYFIFSNTETLQTAWSIEEFECLIIGKISLEEMKQMIDSIK